MLPDSFFDEYAKTGPEPQAAATDAEDSGTGEKEYYTRAEVDQMIADRLSEALSQIREEQMKVVADDPGTDTHQEDETE